MIIDKNPDIDQPGASLWSVMSNLTMQYLNPWLHFYQAHLIWTFSLINKFYKYNGDIRKYDYMNPDSKIFTGLRIGA